MPKKISIILCGIILTVALAANAAWAQQTKSMSVPANAVWTDTGIDVSAGDVITITASGTVIFGDPHNSENMAAPDGKNVIANCNYPVGGVRTHSLVGNIAPSNPTYNLDGKGFFVGSSFEGTVPIEGTTAPQGRLYLGFNDGGIFCTDGVRTGINTYAFYGDNHGSWSVTITVTPYTGVPPVMNNIPDQSGVEGESIQLALADYTGLTDDDPILAWELTGDLPAGLDFDPDSGLVAGTLEPGSAGDYQVAVKAEDKDGWSNEVAVKFLISEPGPIIIGDCDSGVQDRLYQGRFVSVWLEECAQGAKNHGQYVSCVAKLTGDMNKAGLISGAEKGAINSCAAQSDIP